MESPKVKHKNKVFLMLFAVSFRPSFPLIIYHVRLVVNHIQTFSTNSGEGGYKTGEGGHVKFYPYEKGGGKGFSHSEGGRGRAQQVLW